MRCAYCGKRTDTVFSGESLCDGCFQWQVYGGITICVVFVVIMILGKMTGA